MGQAKNLVAAVRSESERLKEYLGALTPDAWGRQSACEMWEVRDVVTHLSQGAQMYAGMVSRGIQGDSSPPNGLPPAGAVNASLASGLIAQIAISGREAQGERALSNFSTTNDELNELLAGLAPDDWDKSCYHLVGIMPVSGFVSLRMIELAMHGWDIRSSLEPPAHLPPASLPVFMEVISGLISKWGFLPASRLTTPIRYRFELTGANSGSPDVVNDVVVEGDRAYMEPGGEAAADTALLCDAETFALVMFGRLTVDGAVSAGRLAVEGDDESAAQFGRWFGGA